jgi:hypothetical protein
MSYLCVPQRIGDYREAPLMSPMNPNIWLAGTRKMHLRGFMEMLYCLHKIKIILILPMCWDLFLVRCGEIIEVCKEKMS